MATKILSIEAKQISDKQYIVELSGGKTIAIEKDPEHNGSTWSWKIDTQIFSELYCQGNHGKSESLCEECRSLLEYAWQRLDRCKFGEQKPNCSKCSIHCYRPEMRERVVAVMRYSGPRMLCRNPLAAIRHLLRR